jgi:DNA-binding MarR family transcriptional regulator
MTTMVNLEDECNGTVVQSRLLGYFAHYKKICLLQSELQQQLSIHRSTIANMLKGMERDGLILRKGTEEAGGPERDSNDSMP